MLTGTNPELNSKLLGLKHATDSDDYYFWNEMSMLPLHESFIEAFAKKLCWYLIVRHQKLSNNFILKHMNDIDWFALSDNPHVEYTPALCQEFEKRGYFLIKDKWLCDIYTTSDLIHENCI